ncbi:unnamed protein product [Orchesella dallaii]|uniref:Uncharacterized protein n=1 Tax=Orchesella dallaii TaxID=48710 RepID=A0ABP1S927_9HEXA
MAHENNSTQSTTEAYGSAVGWLLGGVGILALVMGIIIRLVMIAPRKTEVIPQIVFITQEQHDRRMFDRPINPTLKQMQGNPELACAGASSPPTYEESTTNVKNP